LKCNDLWVSDITYVDSNEWFVYLFLITDVYSHKIVGFHVAESLEARWALKALQMALIQRTDNASLIHHSDRGSQYCSLAYTEVLHQHQVKISMTENGDPRENAVAERVNGILKNELMSEFFETKHQAKVAIEEAIKTYNTIRLHSSVGMITPNEAHLKTDLLKNCWKPKSKTSLQITYKP